MSQLEDMRMFTVTAEMGSFTAAAERLGVTKQFISRRIMALEKRLGSRLLIRTTRKLSVTDTGRSYCERALKILEAVEETEQLVADCNASPRGSLRISAPVSFGTLHLGPAIAHFMTQYPEVKVELDLNDRFVDIVGEGYDMAVRIGQLDDSSLVARHIALTQLLVCASPDYLARRGVPQRPEDLTEHDCLLYGHGPYVEWHFAKQGKLLSLKVTGRLRVNNGELACDAAIAGVGIVFLPSFMVGNALRDNRLQTVLDTFLPPPLGINVVYPQHRQTSQTVRAFADFLRNTFGKADFS